MIRTKDLLLFVIVLGFLTLLIVMTIARDMARDGVNEKTILDAGALVDYDGVIETEEIDRMSLIARLRTQLAAGDVIEASPSVEEDNIDNEDVAEAMPEVGKLDRCPLAHAFLSGRWPTSGVALTTTAEARLLTYTPAGSGAPTQLLLSLPLSPSKAAGAACPTSDVVGVTLSGAPLTSASVQAYAAAGPDTLIGYALDGFPIYGPQTGPTDECGGYESVTGYRYAIVPEEGTVLRCFTGIPQYVSL